MRSGNALSDSIDPKGLFILPSAIARIIKLLRLKNRIKGIGRNYFAIDALRHPFEIRYLRERISPFYSVAVSLPMKLADALDLLIAGTQRIVLKSLMLRSIHLRVKTQRNAKKAIRPLYRKIFKHALLAPRSIFVIMALQKRKTSRSYQDRYVGTSL